MKCDICGNESDSGSLIPGQGFCCSEDCSQIAGGRRKAMLDELLAEPVGQMPEQFETHDFERFMLKFSVHFINKMSQQDRDRIAPLFLIPENLSLELKEKVLAHLHKAYVSDIEYKGHSRLFCNGEYCLRQPVPAEKIVEALRKAELIGGEA